MSLRIGTFNVGQGANDYLAMCSADETQSIALKKRIGDVSDDADLLTRADVICVEMERWAAKQLTQQTDVLCLQELASIERPFAQELRAQGFAISSPSSEPSCAVAYRSGQLELVGEYHVECGIGTSIAGKDFAAFSLVTPSGATVAVGSLHAPGFSLVHPGDQPGMALSEQYVQVALDRLGTIGSDMQVIGADMNNNPEHHRVPFQLMRDEGYRLLRTGKPTNVNPREPQYKLRELDCFFVRGKDSQVARPAIASDFAFTHDRCCSDHLPLVVLV